jgi:hypothetical protein
LAVLLAPDSPPEAGLSELATDFVAPPAGAELTWGASLAFVFPLGTVAFCAEDVLGLSGEVAGRFVLALVGCPLATFAAGWLVFTFWK